MCAMRRLSHVFIAALVLCSIAFGSVATSGGTPAAQAKTFPSTPKAIAAGKALFQKYCRMCHGEDAKGNGPQAPEGTHPPNLIDATWDHGSTDAQIFANIKSGIGPKMDMKGFNSKLTTEDMWDVIHYVRNIGPQGAPR